MQKYFNLKTFLRQCFIFVLSALSPAASVADAELFIKKIAILLRFLLYHL